MTSAEIQPDVLRAAVPKFRAAGDDLTAAMTTLFTGGQGEGAPWGNDDIGKAFAKGYLPAVEEARKGFTAVSTSTRETGEALEIAARKWEERENQTTRKYGD
ncbi:hypothetical protein ALI144C_48630 [Actinosynnema sp. ALI-1.44]|uniref:hypothetical protein n=1 Tax=Actinosynnema sp. ALI-1.44 TaxID=1933779 RepID=UPI00097C0B50|nr:hypothetical protein [Actinosynnema sp. ALI-1.44]ONI70514.1 hypothetical protein ALI144C_48630 [Actinosynnema sp. ALI-1.44]